MTTINVILIIILIALTGFFVATEFAIVKVRTSRIDQLIAEGKKGAVAAKKVVSHLDEYLSACQLGITVTALGLGWLGEPTVERLLRPLFALLDVPQTFAPILSFSIAFALVTFLHVVIGELAPKTVAIQRAEQVTLLFSGPIILFYKIMFPFIWILNGSARLLVGMFGIKPASEHETAHTEEELRILLSESYESGQINKNELKYVNNIFEFDERVAREIMVPRTEIVTLSIDDSYDEVIEIILSERYTRYPVADGDKDNIAGFINAKEFLAANIRNEDAKTKPIQSFINPVIHAVETIPIHDLLIKMQKERIHLAILVDEYGGTSGLVTVEDILEEIVGEIRDEFDDDEIPEIRKLNEDHYILNAKVLIDDVNHLLGTSIINDDIDTIGGWFLSQNLNVNVDSQIESDGYVFKIYESDDYHIHFIEVMKA